MRTNSATWREGAVPPRAVSLRDSWANAQPLTRYLVMAATVLAIGLMWGFYVVVSGVVHRAATGREEARAAADRQVVCSAFSTSSARDLCVLTIATHVPQKAVVRALYLPSPSDRDSRLTAGLY